MANTTPETQELLKQLQAQFAAQGQQLDNESLSNLVRQLQDRDQHDWCEAAGQSEPLTTRLKNLLKDYPADVGLFKEMVQNADDAGAARVHFIWDSRKPGRGSLLSPEMAAWQTNCLWAYNDALFTEQDFEAICRLGVGGKRSSSERIGRFGLGFNSVYNLTDLPSILSDSMILFLDPHVSHLRKMGASTQKPGIKLRFLKVNVLDRFRDQFEPYHKLLGCDLESSIPFKGTLIRIPFRTKESSARSEISKIVVSDEMVAALSQQFQAEAFQWLLFLQNVQEISMSRLVVTNGSMEPVLQRVCSVSLPRAGLTKRPSLVTCGSAGRCTAVSTHLEVSCSADSKDEKQTLRRYHLFTDTQHGFRSRVCLAVPLMQEQDAGGDVWCHDEDGRVFCFLPLPRNVDLGLRLHVHAPLNMAQDRRSVLLDNRIGESEQELVRHNFYLLDDLIPSALLACLQDLAVKRNQMPPAHFFALFPTLHNKSQAPSERIAKTFYAKLLSQTSCPLPVAAPSVSKQRRIEARPAYWVKVADAVFVPSLSSARAEQVTQALLDSVVECLLRCGVPIVDAPPNVLESLSHSCDSCGKNGKGQPADGRANFTILTPSWLRQRLRSEGGMKSHVLKQTPAANIFAQLTPVDVADLLEFAVSDGDMGDLLGVPLLMCEDETMVQPFARSTAQPVFFPQNLLERRLFPNKDGKKLVLASKFEARPLLWAKLRKLAEQQTEVSHTETQKEDSQGVRVFQCKFVTFQSLVKALQQLLPRAWNTDMLRISANEYKEWVEDWLQAMWKWLDDKDVDLFQMIHWPLIPSLRDTGIDLIRIPEPSNLVLFSGTRPASKAPFPSEASASPYPPPPPPPPPLPPSGQVASRNELDRRGGRESSEPSKFLLVQKLLQAHLHCIPIFEPNWLLHHEKQLRSCVHASSAEGLLKSMHFAAKRISSSQSSPVTPSQALHASLCEALSPSDVGALLSIAATVQKEGCTCEKVMSRASWKGQCDVLRGLPLLCRFNKPRQRVSLAGTSVTSGSEDFWILPETCPQVIGALRAAQVSLPTCVEVADEVLATLTSENLAISSLLREHLGLGRLKWCDLLLKHVFPWAHKCSGEVRQGLMRAVVYHWRDMELMGHTACLEALQHIPFVSTVGGSMLSAAEALDPSVEKLPALYGPGDIRGPFPEPRWHSAECRAVLHFRTRLNYRELSERLGFLHHVEVQRREQEENPTSDSTPQSPKTRIPGDVLAVAHALLRYVCEVVGPAMTDPMQTDQEEKQDAGLWGMLGLTGMIAETRPKETKEMASQHLSADELMSIQSKLRRCFWLPPLSAPSGWPTEAPWKGSLCGLCSAEEVRLVSEEFLVGMVRPLIGLVALRGAGNPVRLPGRFLDSIGLQEKPQEGLMREQLSKMEEWAMSLPAAKREVHASWITRCLYDHLYPMLVNPASIEEFASDKTKRLWVSQGGFLPLSGMSRQSIEFPPYLVKAPAEWKEKVPLLWSKVKDNFGVADYSEALQDISKAEQNSSQLHAESLDIAVRLVMAISDNLQQERAENSGAAAAAAGSKLDILMPTSENTLRPARDCVFNNMTWLPDVETADLNLGSYCLVHPKISHAVAHTCGCRGLSLVYAREATEMHGADWCEAAGQSEPITTRLKNLLKDYPADISMFKEMVQNADDAGATEVHFVWDWRQHRKQSLLTPDMDRWQGPSLWIFNNAQFTTKDFDSICRLGVGGKREQQRKIGRFGLGFNSVYNFTDLPSILSGDMVLFLDPHVHHLSAMGASVQKPGIKLRFLKINVLEKFRDQFEPYHGMLGCDLSSSNPFEGTLIRVPFRSPEVAKASEVSSIQLDSGAAEMLSTRFQKEAFQWLLFLQSVSKIRLSEIREGDASMHCLSEVKLMPPSVHSVLNGEEKQSNGDGGDDGDGGDVKPREPPVDAKPQRVSAIGSDGVVADVLISTESFGSSPYQRCLSYRLVGGQNCGVSEQVCAALPLAAASSSPKDQVKLRHEEGRLFCFLPLPPSAVSLRVPMHVHAPLNTTQDRRNVLLDNRVGDNEIVSKNVRLLDARIPECLTRCAINLSNLATPEDFFSVFPVLHRNVGAGAGETQRKDALPEVGAADRVAHSFYRLLIRRTEPIFPTASADSMKKCVPFSEAVFCSEREAKLSSGGPPDQATILLDKIITSLARFGVPVVKIPLPVLESFEQVLHPVLPRTLTPAWLRQFLRNINASSIPKTAKRGFDLRECDEMDSDHSPEKGEGIAISSLTSEEVVAFLDFALADGNFGDLEGVPLLFTQDMKAGTYPFANSGTSLLFVPEDTEDYQLLPQAPRRLLSKKIRTLRPWVWQNLQRMASSEVQPNQKTQGGDGPSFQLRKMTVSPLMAVLQELLPKTWNVPVPEVTKSEWQGWTETWLRTLWNWLSRMSVPAKNMLHWPLVPSLQEEPEINDSLAANESTEVGTSPATHVCVRLYRLLPDSSLFSIPKEDPQETKSSALLGGRYRKPLVSLMQKVGCTPVQLPEWLRDRESQLNGFVHPGTADGLMKACHNRLHGMLSNQALEGNHQAVVLKFRKLFGTLTTEQHSALAAWLVMAGPENCDCPGNAAQDPSGRDPSGWRLKCEIFRTAPLFSPFGRQEQVALVDFDSQGKGRKGSWSLLPEACPEVVAALRAAGITMSGCVEPVDAENIATLVRELHMPRLTWVEVLLEHVFPWASKATVEPAARQGLMLAIVQRWREMDLAGNEQCVEALQQVAFIPTVNGEMRSPATLLDPRKEELKRLYMGDGLFPAAEVNAVLLPLLHRGLLRCRQELSLEELQERLAFLDSKQQLASCSEPEDGEWEKVRECAESFLQYVATTVNMKCQEVRMAAAAAALPEAPAISPPAPKNDKARSFFAWPSIMPLGDFLTAAAGGPPAGEKVEPLAKREEWTEDDVETLKCKLRTYRWIPAAQAPREWLTAIPWAGNAQRLWRSVELMLMPDFWSCGAACPVLDLDTQVIWSGERKQRLHTDFLSMLGISLHMPAIQRIRCAYAQLEAIRSWCQERSEGKANESESAWISKCLYHHVYPLITSEDSENSADGHGVNQLTEINEIFIGGAFVAIQDLSLSQDFGIAGLHQISKELQSTAPKLCSQVRSTFQATDLARALDRLSQKSASANQLPPAEIEVAVHLAMALSERIRGEGEDLPEKIMVPTSQGKLRPAQECVFNNMRWLSEEEQHKRSRAVTSSGLNWVHQSISNDVAISLKVQALSTQVAAEALAAADDGEKDPEWFEAAGQTEPLTVRLRSLLRDISESAEDLGLFKSLLQNADDAKASEVHFVWDWRSFGKQSLMSPEMARWQGPCLWAHNNASFSPQDFENITQLGAVQKSTSRKAQIGRFGLGFNSVYSLTDLPSILSDDVVLFLDPHVQHLRAMGASPAKPGIKLRFLKIDVLDKFRDQFEPYHGIFGCDLASSTPYKGTLIRLPFRTPEAAKSSEISKTVVSPKTAMAFLRAFRDAAAECLVFLQHVQRIEFGWIPPDAGANATPATFMEIKIIPPGIPLSIDTLPSSQTSESEGASTVAVSTDNQALEYRRLFSSRTVAQSKEKQSFISDMLNRLQGLGMSKTDTEVEKYISFNLVVSISWAPPVELRKEYDTEPCNRMEAWRLILQHDNPEDTRWAGIGEGSEGEASFAYVPFGGLALCLSRPLRPEEPRVCSFLPLPIASSLPFLINANFCLSDPTAPGRLDLARPGSVGSTATSKDWNTLLLRNIIEPLICTLIREQSAGLQALRSKVSTEVAVWAEGEGVCSLMPRKSQLPLSLQELLNLPSIYTTLSTSALFPSLSLDTESHFGKQQLAQFLDANGFRKAASLLSYVDSVQPLPDDIGTAEQRQAVHEYLSQVKDGRYRFCHVATEVAQEFSSAGLKRKADVDRSLVLSCLREDSQHKYSCAAASKLLSFVLGGEQDARIASKLQGLKLAPLCDGKVGTFGSEGSDQQLFCAFASDNSRSSFAQRVLQQLAPKATLDLSGLDVTSAERLGQQAEKLGIRHVAKCEELANALLLALPNVRASAHSSMLASLDDTLGGRLLSGSSRQANAGSLGFGSDENASSTLCALWSFIELAEDGLSDEFLKAFDHFYVVPACNPARTNPTGNSAASVDAPLVLIPLSTSEPLLLPECEQSLEPLMEVASALVSDRFVDKSHPAMTDSVLRFLQQKGIVNAFSRGSLLTVLAAWSSAPDHFGSLISRCQRLQPEQRHLLCSQLCLALCDPVGALEDGAEALRARAALVCKLPIFLAESWSDGQNLQAFRSLTQLAVVDGEPLQLSSPPFRLDLDNAFVFRASSKTLPEVAEALGLPEVQEILAEQGKFFDMKTWLQKQVLPHLHSMVPNDQGYVLERLLPLLDIEEANSEPYLIPAEAHAKLMKPPFLILDPQDFTIQEIFGMHGEDWPALDSHHRYHFPAKMLSAPVLSHLRRLGMRKSVGDGFCLAFLCQVLRDQHSKLTRERYRELQRGLMQRIVESWSVLPAGAHRDAILQQAFVDTSNTSDPTDLSETLFELKAFASSNELFKLSDLVSRSHSLDPYLCWTSLPLCPRGFPDFEGYQRPALKDVVAHALALGGLSDGVPLHLWEEFKEKVVGPLCQYLAEHEVFQEATRGENRTDADGQTRECAQVCSRLRKAKFIAVPLDAGSGGTGPHSLVAPWRISLVLKEHRPPMFALPDYLMDHVSILRMLGVRDAVVPQESMVGQESDSANADEAMVWLFENGPESFSDVTVRCDGGSLFLHRNILMSRSEYFKAMFQGAGSGFLESHSSGAEVSLMEFPLDVAKVLFGYLYHGKVHEGPLEGPEGTSNSVDLMCLADQLAVPRLFEFAQLWVANQQDLEDCSEMLKLASRHRADLLERATLLLMAANLDSPEVEQQLPTLAEDQRQKLEDLMKQSKTS